MNRFACLAACFVANAAAAQIELPPVPSQTVAIPAQPEQAPAPMPAPAKMPLPAPAPKPMATLPGTVVPQTPSATLPGTVVPQTAVAGYPAVSCTPVSTSPTVGPITIDCSGKVTGCPTGSCGKRWNPLLPLVSRCFGTPTGCDTVCPAPAPAPKCETACASGPRIVFVPVPMFGFARSKPWPTPAGCATVGGCPTDRSCWENFKAWVCFTPSKGGLPCPKPTPYHAPLRSYFPKEACTGCPAAACGPKCSVRPAAACATGTCATAACVTGDCANGSCAVGATGKFAGVFGLRGHAKPHNASSVDGEMGDGLRFAHPTRPATPSSYGQPQTMPPAPVDPQPPVMQTKYTRPFTNP